LWNPDSLNELRIAPQRLQKFADIPVSAERMSCLDLENAHSTGMKSGLEGVGAGSPGAGGQRADVAPLATAIRACHFFGAMSLNSGERTRTATFLRTLDFETTIGNRFQPVFFNAKLIMPSVFLDAIFCTYLQ
jgi:hypothetical protein